MPFLALFTTTIAVFFGGHALLLDPSAFRETLPIFLACFGTLCLFFGAVIALESVPWALIMTYGLLLGVTYGPRRETIWLIYLGMAFGGVKAIQLAWLQKKNLFPSLLMATIASIVILDCSFSPFDISERLHLGLLHRDTVFHAAIAAMIKNYGVTSTGLHGLVPTPYHSLSHALMASISIISGSSVILVYGVANWLLFCPLLIFSAVYASRTIADKEINIPMAWLAVCGALAFLPWFVDRWTLVHHNAFISESYVLASGIFLIAYGILFRKKLFFSDIAFVAITAGLLGLAKASVAVVFALLWTFRSIFLKEFGTKISWAATIGAVVSVFLATHESATAFANPQLGETLGLELFSHIRRYGYLGEQIIQLPGSSEGVERISLRSLGLSLAALTIFASTHFFFSWWVIASEFTKKNALQLNRNPGLFYTIATVTIGLGLVTFVKLSEGNAYFFFNIAFYASLPLWVISATHFVTKYVPEETTEPILPKVPTWVLLTAGSICIALVGQIDFYHYRQQKNGPFAKNTTIQKLHEIRKTTPYQVTLKLNTEALDPKIYNDCIARPFYYPAITERPWVNVINDKNCHYTLYCFTAYGLQKNSLKIAKEYPSDNAIIEFN